MWQSCINISLKYGEEADILEDGLTKIEGLYFARKDSKNIASFAVACKERDILPIKSKIDKIVADLILTKFKFKQLILGLKARQLNCPICVLISSLLYYDSERERNFVLSSLSEFSGYSVDGFYNFKMKNISREWKELSDMLFGFLDANLKEEDMYALALYILGNREGNKSLFIADSKDALITNANGGGIVDVVKLYGNTDFDIINTIIASGAREVIIGNKSDKILVDTLKNIVNIKII